MSTPKQRLRAGSSTLKQNKMSLVLQQRCWSPHIQ